MANLGVKDLYEVAEELGIRTYRIMYAEKHGYLPEPQRIGARRLYTAKDMERIREYFTDKIARALPKAARREIYK